MSSNKLVTFVAALVFLLLACVALYRLLFWFPIEIGGHAIGQTASFFAFVIFAALTLVLIRAART